MNGPGAGNCCTAAKRNRPGAGVGLWEGPASVPVASAERQAGLAVLLAELEGNGLVVCLVPSRWPNHEAAMVRCVISRNAAWYRRFCGCHPSSRIRRNALPDTRIRRANIVRILTRMIEGLPTGSQYAAELIRFSEAAFQPRSLSVRANQ